MTAIRQAGRNKHLRVQCSCILKCDMKMGKIEIKLERVKLEACWTSMDAQVFGNA